MTPGVAAHRIGLIGAGISTSLSPVLHEAEAAALGIAPYRYELLDLDALGREPADAANIARHAVVNGFTGLNVTHPCKQTVMAGLDEIAPQARLVGAVNTIVVTPSGQLVGHNTDHSGFLAALRSGLPDARLGTVVQTGAGGAGSAVAHALAAAGVRRLLIADVDVSRATDLAARVSAAFGISAAGLAVDAVGDRLADADGLVNASPVGMEGFPGSPVDPAALAPRHWVADIVYRPVRTTLIAAAEARGCSTLRGTRMLVAQAADTFRLVTEHEPDIARMRRHLHDALAARDALTS